MADSQATAITYSGLNQNLQSNDSPISDKGAVNSFDFANNNDRSAVGLYNLGSINANFINVGTLTGVALQTSSSNPKIVITTGDNGISGGTTNAINFYDDSGAVAASFYYSVDNVALYLDSFSYNVPFIITSDGMSINGGLDVTGNITLGAADYSDQVVINASSFTVDHGSGSISANGPTITFDFGTADFTGGAISNTADIDTTSSHLFDIGSNEYYDEIHCVDLIKHAGGGFTVYDDGVELQDGRIVSDIESLMQMKPHPTMKTKNGKPIYDIDTLPKDVKVEPKDKKNGGRIKPNQEGKYMRGDKEVEPGESVFTMMSIMIGAIKELDNRLKAAGI